MDIRNKQQIVLASGNSGKIREIQVILKNHTVIAQSQFDVPEAEETGSTFVENAIIKARNATEYCKMPTIADDSGIVVDALDGAPGVVSARYAGVGASDLENLEKLLDDLQKVTDQQKTARFICVMVFLQHANDPFPLVAQGVWEGHILSNPVGENGFGYDPVFFVPEQNCTSAQLSPDMKNNISHRGKALQQLSALMENRFRVGS